MSIPPWGVPFNNRFLMGGVGGVMVFMDDDGEGMRMGGGVVCRALWALLFASGMVGVDLLLNGLTIES